jgi:hypothetical protein
VSQAVARWAHLARKVIKHQHGQISPAMLLALVEHESGGNKDIVNSTSGAFGLTQFLPSTATSYGVKRGDARSQLRGAVKYLNALNYAKDPVDALDHHYGGAGADGYHAALVGLAKQYRFANHGLKGGGKQVHGGGGGHGRYVKGKRIPGHGRAMQDITGVKLGSHVKFDKAGFQEAEREFALGQLLGQDPANQDNPLIKLGVLPSVAPSEGEFMRNVLTAHKTHRRVSVPGTGVGGVNMPGHHVGGHGRGGPGGRAKYGKVDYSPSANLPGKPVRSNMQHVLRLIAGGTHNHLFVGTGTNHDKMTTNGTVSDHYSGHATDVTMANGQAMVGRNLNHVGNQTLRWFQRNGATITSVLGGSKSSAKHWNRGLFNLNWRNPRTGHNFRVQVIFGTNSLALGGDHTDHMHVGIEPE